MEGVLAQLKVLLSADLTKLSSGLNEAELKSALSAKNINHHFSSIGRSIEKVLGPLTEKGRLISAAFQGIGGIAGEVTGKLSGMGTVFAAVGGIGAGAAVGLGAGMFALAVRAAEAGASIYDASEKTGISADKMSGLAAIAKETGGDFENLTTSLARMGANLTNALIDPSTIGARELKSLLGGTKAMTEFGLKPMGDRLQIVTQKAFALHDIGQRNAILQALLGRGWQQNVDTLKSLAEHGYGPAIEQAKKFGLFFNDQTAEQAKKFTVQTAEMKAELGFLALTIGEKVIPIFSAWMTGLQGDSAYLEGYFDKFKAVFAAAHWDMATARKDWAEGNAKIKEGDQIQTNYLVHLQEIIEQAKRDATANLSLADAHKKTATALSAEARALKEAQHELDAFIKSEQSELVAVNLKNQGMDAAQIRYQQNFTKITALAAATKDAAKAQEAYNLALGVFLGTALIKAEIPESIGPPNLIMPEVPAGVLGGGAAPHGLTLSQLAALPPPSPDRSLATLKALKKETELSAASFAQLAKAFPNLSEAEVAALPAGQKMIDQLDHLEKHGKQAMMTLRDLHDELVAEGNNLQGNLVNNLGGGINQAEGELTKLATGQRFNFVKVAQDLGQSVMGSFIKTGVGSLLGKFGMGGAKADGSSSNPFYVKLVDASGNPLAGGIWGGPLGGIVPTFPSGKGTAGLSGIASEIGGLLKGSGGGILGTLSKFAGMFAGFLAGGGDVSPGRAYVVGEKHPEFFVPKASGRVVPTIMTQPGKAAMVYAPTYNISTPNVDSFRKSHSQIVTEGYRQAALAHARNS
jgi:hypothetical protein